MIQNNIHRLIDKLFGEFLESQCKNPVFIINTSSLMTLFANGMDQSQVFQRGLSFSPTIMKS